MKAVPQGTHQPQSISYKALMEGVRQRMVVQKRYEPVERDDTTQRGSHQPLDQKNSYYLPAQSQCNEDYSIRQEQLACQRERVAFSYSHLAESETYDCKVNQTKTNISAKVTYKPILKEFNNTSHSNRDDQNANLLKKDNYSQISGQRVVFYNPSKHGRPASTPNDNAPYFRNEDSYSFAEGNLRQQLATSAAKILIKANRQEKSVNDCQDGKRQMDGCIGVDGNNNELDWRSDKNKSNNFKKPKTMKTYSAHEQDQQLDDQDNNQSNTFRHATQFPSNRTGSSLKQQSINESDSANLKIPLRNKKTVLTVMENDQQKTSTLFGVSLKGGVNISKGPHNSQKKTILFCPKKTNCSSKQNRQPARKNNHERGNCSTVILSKSKGKLIIKTNTSTNDNRQSIFTNQSTLHRPSAVSPQRLEFKQTERSAVAYCSARKASPSPLVSHRSPNRMVGKQPNTLAQRIHLRTQASAALDQNGEPISVLSHNKGISQASREMSLNRLTNDILSALKPTTGLQESQLLSHSLSFLDYLSSLCALAMINPNYQPESQGDIVMELWDQLIKGRTVAEFVGVVAIILGWGKSELFTEKAKRQSKSKQKEPFDKSAFKKRAQLDKQVVPFKKVNATNPFAKKTNDGRSNRKTTDDHRLQTFESSQASSFSKRFGTQNSRVPSEACSVETQVQHYIARKYQELRYRRRLRDKEQPIRNQEDVKWSFHPEISEKSKMLAEKRRKQTELSNYQSNNIFSSRGIIQSYTNYDMPSGGDSLRAENSGQTTPSQSYSNRSSLMGQNRCDVLYQQGCSKEKRPDRLTRDIEYEKNVNQLTFQPETSRGKQKHLGGYSTERGGTNHGPKYSSHYKQPLKAHSPNKIPGTKQTILRMLKGRLERELKSQWHSEGRAYNEVEMEKRRRKAWEEAKLDQWAQVDENGYSNGVGCNSDPYQLKEGHETLRTSSQVSLNSQKSSSRLFNEECQQPQSTYGQAIQSQQQNSSCQSSRNIVLDIYVDADTCHKLILRPEQSLQEAANAFITRHCKNRLELLCILMGLVIIQLSLTLIHLFVSYSFTQLPQHIST